jgi:hypothetical protein
MLHKRKRPLLAFAAVIGFALVAYLVFSMVWAPAPSPLPNPNGYDDFRKAAMFLTGDVGNASALELDELRALVATNSESLRLLRLGLTRQCVLPADAAMANFPSLLSDFSSFKSLARLLAEEGRLAEMENRYGDAAQSYVDAIHFGNEMSRGGFIINRLVGIACEAIGEMRLGKLVPRLNSQQAKPVIAELEKIDSAGVTWDEVMRNERRFERHQLGKGFNAITWAMTRWQAWQTRKRGEMRNKRVVARVRLVIAELAVRCYQSERGQAPATLEQLVPLYLQRVPLDPFSGRPLLYRPQGSDWLLYSVGEDGADDGGKRAGRSISGSVTRGDLFYNSPY